jgi:3-hydroxymyristoyl/3-hydroxydecanoyl-(acyl carrier protein) dehydratase
MTRTHRGGLRMGDHFAAFSFVDRICEFEPGVRARGIFAIPRGLPSFPSCLVAEATGQLATWLAMQHVDFRGRPVAALAMETRFLRDAEPGDTLDLAVEIESTDDEAVAYHGWAGVNGMRALELIDCLGPMLPTEDFDAPAALRERLGVLRTDGAPADRFHGIEGFHVETTALVPGESAAATFFVPDSAPFFRDHFPRRPVFPATLLLNELITLALSAARGAGAGSSSVPKRMTNVKVRSFTPPGQTLELTAALAASENGAIVASLNAQAAGRVVATARVDLIERSKV